MMSRKDYIQVSKMLNSHIENQNCCDKFIAGVDELVLEFIKFFESDNPNFDSDRFWEACFPD